MRTIAFFLISFIIFVNLESKALFVISPNTIQSEIDYLMYLDRDLENLLPEAIKNQIIESKVKLTLKELPQSNNYNQPLVFQLEQSTFFSKEDTIYANKFYISKISQLINRGKDIPLFALNLKNSSSLPLWNSIDFFVKYKIIQEIGYFYDLNQLEVQSEFAHLNPENSKKASRDPVFLNAARFPEQGFIFEEDTRNRSNFLEDSNIHSLRFDDPQISFSINLSEFLLKQDYKCRHEELYEYYAFNFKIYPFSSFKCNSTNFVFLTPNKFSKFSPSFFKQINFNRVYAIHYLLAGPGKNAVSHYGHAMLRIVLCAPHRRIVNVECVKDIEHHLVVSFKASAPYSQFSVIDAIAGNYSMIEYIEPLVASIDDYTKTELRWLKSLPLKLTLNEIHSVLNSILETHWTYLGKYKFLTNNCADETLQLLKRGMRRNQKIQNIRISRPDTLFNQLILTDLADSTPLSDLSEAEKNGYFFPSTKMYQNLSLNILKRYNLIDKNLSIEEYLELNIKQRILQPQIEKLGELTSDEHFKINSAIMTLERLIMDIQANYIMGLWLKKKWSEIHIKDPNDVSINRVESDQLLLGSPAILISLSSDIIPDGLPNQMEINQLIQYLKEKNLLKLALEKNSLFYAEKELEPYLDETFKNEVHLTRQYYNTLLDRLEKLSPLEVIKANAL